MKKIYTPNHKLYQEYYLNQAKQKGGNFPAFHGARFQRGYGLGSMFKGLFRWALPHLQQGAKVLGKKALQTGVQVATRCVNWRKRYNSNKKACLTSSGPTFPKFFTVRWRSKGYKKESTTKKKQFTSRQESESISAAKEET